MGVLYERTSRWERSGIKAQEAPVELCSNCKVELVGFYCHLCGKPKAHPRITLKRLLLQIPYTAFDVEKGFLRTLIDLTLRPGRVIDEYLYGDRLRYLNPVRYWLISLTLQFVVLFSWLPGDRILGKDNDIEYYQLVANLLALPLISGFALVVNLTLQYTRHFLGETIIYCFFILGHVGLLNLPIQALLLYTPWVGMNSFVWVSTSVFLGYWVFSFARAFHISTLESAYTTLYTVLVLGIVALIFWLLINNLSV